MKVMINDIDPKHFCRIAFAQNLFEAGTVQGEGKPAFSSSFLIPPDHPVIDALEKAEVAVAGEKWGARASAVLKEIKLNDRGVFHDGDKKASYDGYAGNVFISARTEARPTVLDANKSPLVAADGRPYSGCYVNAQIEVWAQDNSYGKRINAQLLGVQFVRDGDSFSAGASPSDPDDFGDLSAGTSSMVD